MSTATTPPTVPVPPTIVRVRANQPTFREVEFKLGFNVVLAERTKESTKKESRNGLGKSSLIEIISFCLGGGFRRRDPLGNEALSDWEFTLDLTLGGRPVSVTRATNNAARVTIDGETAGWPVQPSRDRRTSARTMKVSDWNVVLGSMMFGLPHEGFSSKFTPTFRSLISYFVRKGKDAYSVPFEHYRKQQEWDKQVNNAFLLGIAWQDASDWQQVRVEKKLLEGLKAADKSPLMAEVMQGSLDELEATKVRYEALVRSSEASVNRFEVLPQYRELEREANALTGRITQAVNRIVADMQLLASYEASPAEMPEPNVDDVVAVWEDAGIHFPDRTRRRLEDVKDFHRQLLDNRKRFLSSEIERLRLSISETEAVQRKVVDDRAGPRRRSGSAAAVCGDHRHQRRGRAGAHGGGVRRTSHETGRPRQPVRTRPAVQGRAPGHVSLGDPDALSLTRLNRRAADVAAVYRPNRRDAADDVAGRRRRRRLHLYRAPVALGALTRVRGLRPRQVRPARTAPVPPPKRSPHPPPPDCRRTPVRTAGAFQPSTASVPRRRRRSAPAPRSI